MPPPEHAFQVPVTVQSCVMATESMFGVSSHISTEQYKYYWQQWPSATSFWNSLQWSQIYSSPYEPPGIFEYNYGPKVLCVLLYRLCASRCCCSLNTSAIITAAYM